MTQSIAFIRCKTEDEAQFYKNILDHDLYKFLNNICRWGNFNNIRILQSFPLPKQVEESRRDKDRLVPSGPLDKEDIWNNFNLTKEEVSFIKENIKPNRDKETKAEPKLFLGV
eukprot:SAG22_NODE_2_length_61565_cov_858.782010_47_plen_113_part_00